MQNEKEDNGKHYLHRPTWWLGIALMALGEVGNFSAYGFAPASLVAPLGTATVVGKSQNIQTKEMFQVSLLLKITNRIL